MIANRRCPKPKVVTTFGDSYTFPSNRLRAVAFSATPAARSCGRNSVAFIHFYGILRANRIFGHNSGHNSNEL